MWMSDYYYMHSASEMVTSEVMTTVIDAQRCIFNGSCGVLPITHLTLHLWYWSAEAAPATVAAAAVSTDDAAAVTAVALDMTEVCNM